MNTLISNQVFLLTVTAKSAIDVLTPFIKGAYAIATLFAIVVIAIAAIIYYVFKGVNQAEPSTQLEVETVVIEEISNDPKPADPVIELIVSSEFVTDFPVSESATLVYEPVALDNLDELSLEQLHSIARSNKVKGWNMYKKTDKLAAKLREVMNA